MANSQKRNTFNDHLDARDAHIKLLRFTVAVLWDGRERGRNANGRRYQRTPLSFSTALLPSTLC